MYQNNYNNRVFAAPTSAWLRFAFSHAPSPAADPPDKREDVTSEPIRFVVRGYFIKFFL